MAGIPSANRREARKLGLLRKQKFLSQHTVGERGRLGELLPRGDASPCNMGRSRTRAIEVAGTQERVCGECPIQVLF